VPNLFFAARRFPLRRRSAEVSGIEALEPRRLLSVSLDANGWTVAARSPGARVIYVSSSSGNDINSGLSPSAPVKSLHHAESLLRNDSADEMLLECGDVWDESLGVLTVSGRSDADPIVVGTYGTGPRPLLDTGAGNGLTLGMTSSPQINYVDIIGLDFYADTRDPASPVFSSAAAEIGSYGIYIAARTTGLNIEDCEIRDYGTDITVEPYFGPVSDLTIRRSDILDAYTANGSHSEGLYANGVAGLVLQGNTFDHDGWNASVPGAQATIFNHDAYLSSDNSGVVVTDNIFADASSHGLQARSGGDIESNLFLDDPIGMSFGLVNGSPITPGGVSGIVNGNVFIGTATINGQVRGYGMEIGNTSPDAQTIVSNNIFSSNEGGNFAAILLEYGQGVTNPAQAVGINNLTIEGNIVYDWTAGLSIESGMQPGGTGARALNHLAIRNNSFDRITGSEVFEQGTALNRAQESLSENTFSSATSKTPAGQLGAQLATNRFIDPTRSAATFDASLGGPGTVAAFVDEAAARSSGAWQENDTADAAVAYVQAGFETANASPHDWLAPTPPLAAALVPPSLTTTTDDSTISISVSYTDSGAVDLTSIGSGNVRLVGPRGRVLPATLVSVVGSGGGPVIATYSFAAPARVWRTGDAGSYTLGLLAQQLRDTNGFYTPAQALKTFRLHIARAPAPPQVRHVAINARGSQRLAIQFSSDVGASITAADLVLSDSTGNIVNPSVFSLSYNTSNNSANWTFPGLAGGVLPAGSYHVTLLAAGIHDAAGRHLDGDKNGIGGDDFVWRRVIQSKGVR
jgi:hypothetical protein